MKSLILEAPGAAKIVEVAEPKAPSAGEVLVQVHRAGVCGTDLHAYRGRQPFFTYPRVLGHELGVEVVAVGEGAENLSIGDRCAVEPYLNCRSCVACRRGKGNCCTSMQVLGVHVDGGMRPFLVLPASKLHSSRVLSFDQLALVETLGIGAHAVARSGIEAGETVLVIGAGPIGFAVLQFVKLAGATPVLLDINPARLEFAKRVFGIETVLDARQTTPEWLEETLGDLPTCVFDATGNPGSMNGAFEYVAAGGKLVLVGLHQGEVMFQDPLFHRREMTLIASRNALPADLQRVLRAAEARTLDTTPWITHRVNLEEAPEHFSEWLDPDSGTLKAMIEL